MRLAELKLQQSVAGLSFPNSAASIEKQLTRHFDVRMFGVLRFVIQPFFLALEKATGESAEPQNIELANVAGKRPGLI